MTALPPVGARVRVTLEGVVEARSEGDGRIDVVGGASSAVSKVWPGAEGVTVEVLAEPRPEWADTPGEAVRDDRGVVWSCTDGGIWLSPGGSSLSFDVLSKRFGPLTHLVPESTP